MRALCGAIITAGALIGLGLTAIGYGIRYQGFTTPNPETHFQWGAPSMIGLFAIIFCGLLIGIGIAFIGLMFHHHRRYLELHRHLGQTPEQRVGVP